MGIDPQRSLQNRFPEIAAEWHPTKNDPLIPNDVTFTYRMMMTRRAKLTNLRHKMTDDSGRMFDASMSNLVQVMGETLLEFMQKSLGQ